MLRLFLPRPHRLEARTWPSQGQNTGSIPVGAIRTPVRFPLCAYPTESPDRTVHFPAIVLFRLTLRKPGFDFLKSCTACFAFCSLARRQVNGSAVVTAQSVIRLIALGLWHWRDNRT